ncbi:DUF402 domain-containing protein [Kribbella sp. NPDC050124]|uniref:DUF402 domain-containing protein n=1 Tax=Kribbella sp. NPDC050124 TaxID=3364114 RepID=UPI0037AF72C1
MTFIRKRKRPAGSGLWPTYELETDEHGTWFFTPQHTPHRGDDGTFCEVAETRPGGPGQHALHLVPPDGWWFATWLDSGRLVADVSTPPTLIDNEWVYVDLELDPFRRPSGTVGVRDWDDLAEAHRAGLIDDVEREVAVRAALNLLQQFTDAMEPFGAVGWDRLRAAIARGLPPLTEFGDRPLS